VVSVICPRTITHVFKNSCDELDITQWSIISGPFVLLLQCAVIGGAGADVSRSRRLACAAETLQLRLVFDHKDSLRRA
jgi:hypothetical protein